MIEASGATPPTPRLRRLPAGARAAVERFFLHEMDEVALYWRFFRTMTPATVQAYVTQIPFAGDGAVFGAFLGERLVGVAELASIPGAEACRDNRPGAPGCAEFGIAVSGRERRQGIARQLLARLLHYAWARGLKRVQMSSLKDNHPMLHLAASLGFRRLREQTGEIIMQASRPADWRPDDAIMAGEEQAMDEAGAAACEGERNCTVRMLRGCCE